MIYATYDAKDNKIKRGAEIREFPNRKAAIAYLTEGLDGPVPDTCIVPGEWMDCWLSKQRPPHHEAMLYPFRRDQILVTPPGEHGGRGDDKRYFWVTPLEDVLVLL